MSGALGVAASASRRSLAEALLIPEPPRARFPRIPGLSARAPGCPCDHRCRAGPVSSPIGHALPLPAKRLRLGDFSFQAIAQASCLRPPARRRPCSASGRACAPRGGPVDCVALGNRSRAGAPESGREALAYACTWAWRGPGCRPLTGTHHRTSVLRHTALGQCSRDGLHATVCRHRFLSVPSICLASWSTGPRWA